MKKPFYISTSIAYVNGAPHVGFAMESIEADVLARYARSQNRETFFCTGTDEHGEKIQKTADALGITPQEICDKNAAEFQKLGKALNLSNDFFIRTSDQKTHWGSVQKLWKKMAENGDIEKRNYTANYCYGCEAFLTEKDLDESGNCPHHLRPPEEISEENYFFTLSKYSEKIAELIETKELEIIPHFRANEILQVAKSGFFDVSFSRPSKKLPWGIPVPADDSQNMYVWCDALTNYISALGYDNSLSLKEKAGVEQSSLSLRERVGVRENLFQKFWNEGETVHVVGKDIVRFHAGIWIGMLLSAGVKIPNKIVVHGFLTSEGHKMSKSLGNVVDPFVEVEKYGADALRYFLIREVPLGNDADFSRKRFEEIYQAHLANGLGNLVSRVANLWKKCDGSLSLRERARVRENSEFSWKHALPEHILSFSRDLRKNQTDAEHLLWEILRNRNFGNLKFKRQVPFGNYIVDFYCHEKKITIELDGSQHGEDDQKIKDETKEKFLLEHGIKTLRFWNRDVCENTEGILEVIWKECFGSFSWEELPHPNPLPKGEGDLEKNSLPKGEGDLEILKGATKNFHEKMEKFLLHEALAEIFKVVDFCDGQITEKKPWESLDSEETQKFLAEMVACVEWIAEKISIFLPETAEKIQKCFSLTPALSQGEREIPMLFPRLEKLNLPRGETQNLASLEAPKMPEINFTINPETKTHAEFVFLENIAVKKTPKGLQKFCKKMAEEFLENGGKQNVDWKNRVEAQYAVMESQGFSREIFKNAPDGLGNLVEKNGKLPNFSNIVDLYNIISLKHALSAGAHDCAFLSENIKIDFISGTEIFEAMKGKEYLSTENVPLQKGEWAFFLSENEIGCRFDAAQCEKSKIVEGNKNLLVYFHAPQGHENWAKAAMEEFLEKVKEFDLG